MNAKDAVARRIHSLCLERGIAVNALANLCGVAPSTIYSMLNAKSKNPGIITIQKICDGLEISIRMYEALKAAGNDVRLITIPGQGHGFFYGEEYYEQIFRFLEEVLS